MCWPVPRRSQALIEKVRALFGYRRMTCVDKAEVAEITGYEIGTVTPLLLKTNMPIVFDSTLLSEPWVTISKAI